jgi:hypothetical protein
MLSRLVVLVLPALLGAAVAAQAKPLVLRTAHAPTLRRALDVLGVDKPVPKLSTGQNWLLELGPKGEFEVKADESLIAPLQIAIRPKLLMKRYPGVWAAGVQRLRDAVTGIWRDAGIETAEALRLFGALVDFPQQVAQVRLRISGDLSAPLRDVDAQIWLRPAKDTWLARFIETVRPLGLPTIQSIAPDSAATLRVAVELDGASEALAPIAGMLARTGASSPRQAEQSAGAYWEAFDGSLVVSWNPENGSVLSVAGLRNPDLFRDLYRQPELAEWMASARTNSSGFEVEYTPNALTTEQATLWKSVARPTGAVSSRMPDAYLQREIVSYGGVASSYLLGTINVEETGVRALVDAASKHAFPRDILPSMFLARLEISPARFLAPRGDEIDVRRLPSSVTIGLGSTGELLLLSLRLR